MSDLVGNPEDWFSRVAAQMYNAMTRFLISETEEIMLVHKNGKNV